MKLYFYGGSFDPPHLGHKQIINYFSKKSDKLLVVPTHTSPLKSIAPAKYSDRVKMLELMLGKNISGNISIVDYELQSKTPYTVDLVKLLKLRFPLSEINMIIGCDQFNNIKKWKNYDYIIENIKISVVSRPNFKLKSDFCIDNYIEEISIDISSSFIRKNITSLDMIAHKIDQNVMNYIISNKLYL